MSKQAKDFNKIREVRKKVSKIRNGGKNVNKIVQLAQERSGLKADPINSATFLVREFGAVIRRNSCSDVPSSAHQHRKASGVMDGNFPYWAAALMTVCMVAVGLHGSAGAGGKTH